MGLLSPGSGRAFLWVGLGLGGCGGATNGILGSSLAFKRFRANSLVRKASSAAFFVSWRVLHTRYRSFSSRSVASTLKNMSNRVSPLLPRRICKKKQIKLIIVCVCFALYLHRSCGGNSLRTSRSCRRSR